MSELRNISVYIKRCELYHDKNYIINACHNCKYGKVCDIKFIEKQDNQGRKYNGAILTFTHWYNSSIAATLFNDLSNSQDESAKMYHDPITMRFWHVIIFKPKFSGDIEMGLNFNMMTISDTKKDQKYLEEMENKYYSMLSQMNYMQCQLEKAERKMMKYEQKATQDCLEIFELKSKLEEKDNELYILNEDNGILVQTISESNAKIIQLEQDAQYGSKIMTCLQSELDNMRYSINSSYSSYYVKKENPIEEIV
jgi:hypothetical protein